jgi:hypothetical protein
MTLHPFKAVDGLESRLDPNTLFPQILDVEILKGCADGLQGLQDRLRGTEGLQLSDPDRNRAFQAGDRIEILELITGEKLKGTSEPVEGVLYFHG